VTFTPTDSVNYLSAVTSALVTIGGVENPTADMDGDAFGGTINLVIKKAPDYNKNQAKT
jgi:hypothetical protein